MPKEKLELVEVSPRDGLQNEPDVVSTANKLELINRIVDPLNLTGGAPAQAMQGLFGGLGNIV